jgi:hypothetical protein
MTTPGAWWNSACLLNDPYNLLNGKIACDSYMPFWTNNGALHCNVDRHGGAMGWSTYANPIVANGITNNGSYVGGTMFPLQVTANNGYATSIGGYYQTEIYDPGTSPLVGNILRFVNYTPAPGQLTWVLNGFDYLGNVKNMINLSQDSMLSVSNLTMKTTSTNTTGTVVKGQLKIVVGGNTYYLDLKQ